MTAADGRQALDVFRHSADIVDVVLLDMTMPHMDGETTFGRLQQIRDDVPVIVSSGYNTQEAKERFAGSRPAGFLQKPYRLDDLVAAIRIARAD